MTTVDINPEKVRLYDWNGTLLDDTGAAVTAANTVLRHVGQKQISLDQFQDAFQLPIENYYTALGYEPREARAYAKHGKLFHSTYEAIEGLSPLRGHAAERLKQDADDGYTSIILSNHIEPQIRVQLQRLGIDGHIVTVLANPDFSRQFRAPKSARFKDFAEKYRVNLKKAVIIGDTAEETQIAREFGMTSVAITGGYMSERRLAAARPDHIIHSLADLKYIA